MSEMVPLYGFGGGGGDLNFKVVGGTTRPSNPSENTIWVNTSETITSWIFSANQPANHTDGIVWIQTGTESAADFNALKKNSIQVFPLSAKQYIDGAWVDKSAESYQNGEWVTWIKYLIRDGVVGAMFDFSGNLRSTGTINQTYENGYINYSANVSSGPANTEKIDVTNYTKLTAKLNPTTLTSGSKVGICLSNSLNTYVYENMIAQIVASATTTKTGEQKMELDISELNGLYYPAFFVDIASGTCVFRAFDFYLS